MTKEATSISLGSKFYKELARLAWDTLEAADKQQIQRFLVLRFAESESNVLDDLTQAHAVKLFRGLVEAGQFDASILERLESYDIPRHLDDTCRDEAFTRVNVHVNYLTDGIWKEWLAKEAGYAAMVRSAVEKLLDESRLDSLIKSALEKHLAKSPEQLEQIVARAISSRIREHITPDVPSDFMSHSPSK